MSTMRIHHFLEQQCGSNAHIMRVIVENCRWDIRPYGSFLLVGKVFKNLSTGTPIWDVQISSLLNASSRSAPRFALAWTSPSAIILLNSSSDKVSSVWIESPSKAYEPLFSTSRPHLSGFILQSMLSCEK